MQAASPAWNVPTRKLVDLRGACLLQSSGNGSAGLCAIEAQLQGGLLRGGSWQRPHCISTRE